MQTSHLPELRCARADALQCRTQTCSTACSQATNFSTAAAGLITINTGQEVADPRACSAVPFSVKKRGSHVCDSNPDANGRYFARYLWVPRKLFDCLVQRCQLQNEQSSIPGAPADADASIVL